MFPNQRPRRVGSNYVPGEMGPRELATASAWYWAYYGKVQLQASTFRLEGHTWQVDPMNSKHNHRVGRKAAQMGWSELEILKTLHGMIHKYYPTGVMYLFPTSDDVGDFSKARFGPLIESNQKLIGRWVKGTDSTFIKKIRDSMLYLRGGRLTSNVDNTKKDSSKLRSVPVDKVVIDERDLIEDGAVDMAKERMSHSDLKHYVSFSTPTIPDFGVDLEYKQSDRQVWMIKCQKCNTETCAEIEFPECVTETGQLLCKKCRQQIFSVFGRWVARNPERSKESEGRWISQLNSPYINAGEILSKYLDPPGGRLYEIYNSKLGLAYIPAENQLTKKTIYECCGMDSMSMRSNGPCAMGVDVGRQMHVVIGGRISDNQDAIFKVCRVTSMTEIHDLAKRFNVTTAVFDIEPETRMVRQYQAAAGYEVWLCDYNVSNPGVGISWNEQNREIKAYRTEAMDVVLETFHKNERIILPRRCEEVEQFALEMTKTAKVAETDKKTGAVMYRYKKLGDDHYFHATVYFFIAKHRVNLLRSSPTFRTNPVALTDFNVFSI